jgi:hypothetical protein
VCIASVWLLLQLILLTPATSAAGSAACPNSQSPGFRAYLPDCRAYEMVSPVYKEAFSPVLSGGVTGLSENGEQMLVENLGSFAGVESPGGLGANYRIERTGIGWKTAPLEIPLSRFPIYSVVSVSPDFSRGLWFATGQGGIERDVFFSPISGPLIPIGPSAPPGGLKRALNFTGASKDLLHVIFTARSPQGEEEHTIWPGDPTTGERSLSLYEYVGTDNIEPLLVGVSDEHRVAHISESHLVSDCGTTLGDEEDTYNAISETGATVFFTASACGGSPTVNELYARVGEEKSVAISEPPLAIPERECTGVCREDEDEENGHKRSNGIFEGASQDGSKVFFRTTQSLVNSDEDGEGTGSDLYEAEIEGEGGGAEGEGTSAHVSRLIQISHDLNAGQAAEMQGMARVSEDGSHVYFVAKGVLTTEPDLSLRPGHQVAVEGEDNLYVYERDARYPDGHTSFVTTLSATDSKDWGPTDLRPVQATSDGHFLVFQSTADLTPDQEGRENDATQVFEYDAEAETLVRVSQGQDGYNKDGNTSEYPATIPHQEYVIESPVNRFLSLAISADGSHVFFSSEDALTPQALDGVNSVYEYDEGRISLISDGHDNVRLAEQAATELVGTDESGRDVFFTTADSLVPQDTDTQVDLYDARIDGGFPAPATPVPCMGDPCQNPPSVAPSLLVPGVAPSTAEPPPANSVPDAQSKAQPKKKPKKLKRRAKKSKGKKRKISKGRGRS